MLHWFVLVLPILSTLGCTRAPKKKMDEPLSTETGNKGPREIDVPTVSPVPAAPALVEAIPSPSPLPQIKCESFGKLPSAPPVGVGKPIFVVTRVLKKCSTAEGQDGYEPDTPYLAMGFPCTAGGGETVLKGNTYDPRMISFKLAIGCPMMPKDLGTVSATLKKEYGVFENAKLAALTPFEIQFWELENFPDADVGSVIELRSSEALKKGWESLQKKEPLKVRLVGRESSWMKGGQHLQADASIIFESYSRFRLEVASVKVLAEAEYAAIKQRCLALQPRRECAEAFQD